MRVLATAATRHGGTAEILERIAAALSTREVQVSVLAPGDVADVDGYDAVVIGSGVYAGQWLPAVRDLVARLAQPLGARPVWLFSSGPVGDPLVPRGEPEGVKQIIERLRPRDHRVFAGRLDSSRLSLAEKMIVKALRVPHGDYRDWAEIDAWAAGIAATLTQRSATAEPER